MPETSEENSTTSKETNRQGSKRSKNYIQAVPFDLDVDLKAERQVISISPWRAFMMTAIIGTLNDPPHTQQILFVYEWPVPYFLALNSVSKMDKEYLHLSRYSTDCLLATGALPYQAVEPGSDPPDFTCKTTEAVTGLDCTQFTIPVRQTVSGLFEKIRSALLKEPRAKFVGLRGSIIYMWIEEGEEMGLPFRINDDVAIQEVISSLANYAVDLERLEIPSIEMPEKLPDLGLKRTTRGCTFYSGPMLGAVPNSHFLIQWGLS